MYQGSLPEARAHEWLTSSHDFTSPYPHLQSLEVIVNYLMHTHTCMCACTHTVVHALTCMYAHTIRHMRTRICTHNMHTWTCTCTIMYTRTCTNMNTNIQTHPPTHTHTHLGPKLHPYISDYKPTPFSVESVNLNFILNEDVTHVHSVLSLKPNYQGPTPPPLKLDGRKDVKLVSIKASLQVYCAHICIMNGGNQIDQVSPCFHR